MGIKTENRNHLNEIDDCGQGIVWKISFSYLTLSTIALNASGLFTARSASTLRLISMPSLCRSPMRTE